MAFLSLRKKLSQSLHRTGDCLKGIVLVLNITAPRGLFGVIVQFVEQIKVDIDLGRQRGLLDCVPIEVTMAVLILFEVCRDFRGLRGDTGASSSRSLSEESDSIHRW
jgi:hypothetical protein